MNVSIKQVKEKLCDKLVNTGWSEKLRFFLRSNEFEDLLLELYTEIQEGHRFTPGLADIFRPFELCKLPDTKLVILNKEPYTNPILNTGLAIESTDEKTIPYKAFLQAVGNMGDFSRVAKQGVLFLNTCLTTRVESPWRHCSIWRPFIDQIIENLNDNKDLVWLIIGSNDHREDIDSDHFIIDLPRLPVSTNEVWNTGDAFKRIDQYFVQKKLGSISW